jgi:phosphoribosylformylglycinamidine cyclo-ligase
MQKEELTYKEAGVNSDKEEVALRHLVRWTARTFDFKAGLVKLKGGYFANVIDIGEGRGLAISTDGVGTKILIAQLMEKYDTIGIDCVAMNVNDLLCVGAEPISMVDYLAVDDPEPELLEQIGKGLYQGAKLAKISICGGEVAQLREMITGLKKGYQFDLVGTAVGMVDLKRIIVGQDIQEGEVVVAFASSGIHSNGLTLARKALFKRGGLKVDSYISELGKTLGEELLEPTLIYVSPLVEMIKAGINIKALINITGEGFLNLARVSRPVSYLLDNLPSPQPIFSLIQRTGNITDEEMFRVFNMGVGFCLVIPEEELDVVQKIASKHNIKTSRIGYIRKKGKREVLIPGKKLIGREGRFIKY